MAEPSFDWCSFFALFWNDKGIRCKLNIPDTVLFRYGQLSAWWATNKEGYVQRHASQNTSVEAIRKRFLVVSNEDDANYSKFVTISRHGDGRPQLLRPNAFNQLCELLSDRLECGHPDAAPEIETPSVLQAFIQPYQDVRYVTTLINDGKNVSCHTFQRKYSRRYAAMSATAAASPDMAQETDVMLGGDDADARRAEAEQQMGPVDPSLKMQLRKLTAHLVRYIQRAHNLTLGGIVCEYVRDVAGKVYLLSVLRTEWASNAAGGGAGSLGAAALLAPPTDEVGAEAAAALMVLEDEEDGGEEWGAGFGGGSPRGAGSGPWGAGAPLDGAGAGAGGPDSFQSGGGGGADASVSGAGVLASGWVRPSTAGSGARPMTAGPGGRPGTASSAPLTPTGLAMGAGGGAGSTRSSLALYPGGTRSSGIGLAPATNTWPSYQHDAQISSPGSPMGRSAELAALIAEREARGVGMGGAGAGALPPKRAQSADLVAGRGGRAGGAANGRPMSSTAAGAASRISFGRSVPPGGPLPSGLPPRSSVSPQRRSASPPLGAAATAVVSVVTASGAHVNAGVRGAPLLIQQLQREVEALRDELLYQHDLAEASAAKIRQLEQEKAVTTGAFSSRSSELSHMLASTSDSLEATRADRDSWRARAEAAEARVSELEALNAELQRTVNEERGTVMKALREFHDKESEQGSRAEQLEFEVQRLSEQLKAESVAANALKRQLLQYSDIAERYKNTIKDGNIDAGMEEVLQKIGHLFSNQANPTGEEYAVQKVLSHYQTDLRAVFLYYAQLDTAFTEHWPPSLSFSSWMLFCKDSQTSDMRAGARIRSNVHALMLAPTECEAVFSRYSRTDYESAVARGDRGGAGPTGEEQLLTYELFLAALVHLASKLMRPEVPFLSEGVREYVLRYVSKADRVASTGPKKGQLRAVLEGTARGSSILAAQAGVQAGSASGYGAGALERKPSNSGMVGAGPSGSPANGKKYGKASRVRSAHPGKRSGAGGGDGDGDGFERPGSASAGRSVPLSGPDRASGAIMHELSMLGLDRGQGVNREPVRRGGGFDLA